MTTSVHGVQRLAELLVSGDIDLLYDPRQNLDLIGDVAQPHAALPIG